MTDREGTELWRAEEENGGRDIGEIRRVSERERVCLCVCISLSLSLSLSLALCVLDRPRDARGGAATHAGVSDQQLDVAKLVHQDGTASEEEKLEGEREKG